MPEYISVKELARILSKSPRSIQMAKDSYTWRMKDKKSIEILVSSLSEDIRMKIAQSNPAQVPAVHLAPETQVVKAGRQLPSVGIASGAMSEKQKRNIQIARAAARPSGTMSRSAWFAQVASYFGVSTATVRRIHEEAQQYGIGGKPQSGRSSKWTPEAESFLKGFYLKAIDRFGACTRQSAYDATVIKAAEMGWTVGGRSSAYEILADIHPLLLSYAKGGNRALDNHFYISRDLSNLQPMQVIVGDQHIFDYWVADYDKGEIYRQECYVWLDMGTRLIYGIAFDRTYDSTTVKEALRFGLRRFGLFDCTYNDNGSSECSKAFLQIADDLIRFNMRCRDWSELYRTSDGLYAVVDDDEQICDLASSPAEWRRKSIAYDSSHRAMHARVRNAKAKPIERFFNTLETLMDDMHIPGRCATLAAPADIDEKEQARLKAMKDRHELLTPEEFQGIVIEAIQRYETRVHSSLGMSPRDWMMVKVRAGWQPVWLSDDDLEMIMLDRCTRKVDRGRVTIDNVPFIGEEIRLDGAGDLADVGLWRYEGKTVEIRYDRRDLTYAYAVCGSSIRALRPVKAIHMLDDTAMADELSWKKRSMKAVRIGFDTQTWMGAVGRTLDRSPEVRAAIEEKTAMMAESRSKAAELLSAEVEDAVLQIREEEIGHAASEVEAPPLFYSNYDRYKWCQDQLIAHCTLDDISKRFMASYEASEEYAEDRIYWENYRKLGGA